METKRLLSAVFAFFTIIGVVLSADKYDDADYYGYYDDPEYYEKFSDNSREDEPTIVGNIAKLIQTPANLIEQFSKTSPGVSDGSVLSSDNPLFFGPNELVERSSVDPSGLAMRLSASTVYSQNAKGGLSTHKKAGRFSGDYRVELAGDMEKLFGLKGGLYMNAEGSWSKTAGRRSLDVVEFWYENSFDDDTVRLRVGKLDLTGGFQCRGCPMSFDGNAYANSNASQFLNIKFQNNPQIPFPEQGLGIMLHYNPVEYWYAGFGVADGQADLRETGFRTAFQGEDFYMYMFETGLKPYLETANGSMPGAYRVGLWIDAKDKSRFSNGANYRNDIGVYSSCEQMIYKENKDPDDLQGAGVFGRWGWANSDLNDISQFLSFGVQYQGMFDGRDDDVLAFGMAYSVFSDKARANEGAGFEDDNETAYEVYYNAVVSENLTVTPSLQYLKNSEGSGVGDTFVVGLRAFVAF